MPKQTPSRVLFNDLDSPEQLAALRQVNSSLLLHETLAFMMEFNPIVSIYKDRLYVQDKPFLNKRLSERYSEKFATNGI